MRLYPSPELRGRIIDLDTSQVVPRVLWVDEEAGLLEAYETDNKGSLVPCPNGSGYKFYIARGRFKFIPTKANLPKILLGAPRCVKCSNPLTLPGDDLCPTCRASERGQRHRMRVERILYPLLTTRCSYKGCSRLAEYSVADEVEVSPSMTLGVLKGRKQQLYWDRGMTVDRRWYCSFHYIAPRILDSKGEVITILEEAHGVRPD